MKTYNYLLSALLALAFFGVSANAQQSARRNGSNRVTARQENKVERQQNKVDKVQMPTNLSNQNATDLKVRDARGGDTPQGSYGTTDRTPRVNGSSSGSSGSGYGNRPPQGSGSGSGNGGSSNGSAYGNRPPQGGNNNGSYGGSGYGNRPPQGSGSGSGYGNSGSSNGSAYGNRPPQGGNNDSGYGNRPPQNGGNSGSGYGNRPPQNGGNSGSGYGNRPPQGGNSGSSNGNSGSAYGNQPPQGIPEVARRPALPPVIVYSRPEIYERTNANSIVVNTLFTSKEEAYDYIAALLDARYYTITAYGNNYNRIISDVAFIPTPFDWTNPMTHNQFKMQFDISRVFGTVRVTITAYWRESVLSTGFTRLRFQPSDRYSTYYAWRVLEDFASEIPHTAIRYN